jgi:hypothetical protein
VRGADAAADVQRQAAQAAAAAAGKHAMGQVRQLFRVREVMVHAGSYWQPDANLYKVI